MSGTDEHPPTEESTPRATDQEVRILLAELEQSRDGLRMILRRRSLVTTSAIAAGGLVLAYALFGEDPKSLLAIAALPVIVGGSALVLIREKVRESRYREHVRSIERQLEGLDRIGIEDFDWTTPDGKRTPFGNLFKAIAAVVYVVFTGIVVALVVTYPAEVGLPRTATGARVPRTDVLGGLLPGGAEIPMNYAIGTGAFVLYLLLGTAVMYATGTIEPVPVGSTRPATGGEERGIGEQ